LSTQARLRPFGTLSGRLADIILLVWLTGVFVFLVRFAVGLARLAWASRRAKLLPESQRLLFLPEISDR